MFIKNVMTPKEELLLLKLGMTVGESLNKMHEINTLTLPVIDDEGNFVGILGKRALFEYLEKHPTLTLEQFSDLIIDEEVDRAHNRKVDIMKDHIEDCLPVIVRYPFVPVVDGSKFVGIVKRSDLEKALESAFGLHVKGVRFMLAVDDTEGTLRSISDIFFKHRVNIISAVSFEAGDTLIRRVLIKAKSGEKTDKIAEDLEDKGYRVLEITEE